MKKVLKTLLIVLFLIIMITNYSFAIISNESPEELQRKYFIGKILVIVELICFITMCLIFIIGVVLRAIRIVKLKKEISELNDDESSIETRKQLDIELRKARIKIKISIFVICLLLFVLFAIRVIKEF